MCVVVVVGGVADFVGAVCVVVVVCWLLLLALMPRSLMLFMLFVFLSVC